jgi:hypothetical protein
MKNKEQFLKAMNTLLWSWGSDAPAEAVWAANELLDWYELEYNVKIPLRIGEENSDIWEEIEIFIRNN